MLRCCLHLLSMRLMRHCRIHRPPLASACPCHPIQPTIQQWRRAVDSTEMACVSCGRERLHVVYLCLCMFACQLLVLVISVLLCGTFHGKRCHTDEDGGGAWKFGDSLLLQGRCGHCSPFAGWNILASRCAECTNYAAQ